MITVKLEVSRGAVKRGMTTEQALGSVITQIAGRLSTAIRARVQERGDLAGQTFPGWDSKHKWFAVSPRYPAVMGGQQGRSGAWFFPTSADYHRMQGTQRGTYSTTGGMWSGLSVVVDSATRATIEFRGRSIGQSPNWSVSKRGNKKRRLKAGQVFANGIKENNRLKAWTVYAKHGVNLLALSDAEMRAIAISCVRVATLGVAGELPLVDYKGPALPGPAIDDGFREAGVH